MSAEQEYRRFLVVVAHPDDAEFSCAGTVARWIREGREGFDNRRTARDAEDSAGHLRATRVDQRLRDESACSAQRRVQHRALKNISDSAREPDNKQESSAEARGTLGSPILLANSSSAGGAMEISRWRSEA